MSRFSRVNSAAYRTWAPKECQVRIEYSAQVLREVRLERTHGDAGGVLYGVRHGNELRVLAARGMTDDRDPRLAGLDPVGIFAARTRGEVFLTESDLERFEEFGTPGAVALVVSGARGGFFVREADGSMLAIRSYQEFPVPDGPPETALVHTPRANRGRLGGPIQVWPWIALGTLFLLTLFVLLRSSSKLSPPLALTVHGEEGQLRIAWNLAASRRGQLEIRDGARQSTIPISATLASATYTPSGGDVEVRLMVPDGGTQSRLETARFLVSEPPPSPETARAQARIAKLEAEARRLLAVNQKRRASVTELRGAIERLRTPTPAP